MASIHTTVLVVWERGAHGTPCTVVGIRVRGISAVITATVWSAVRRQAILETAVAVGDAVESIWRGWWAFCRLCVVVISGGCVLVLFFLCEETHVEEGLLKICVKE